MSTYEELVREFGGSPLPFPPPPNPDEPPRPERYSSSYENLVREYGGQPLDLGTVGPPKPEIVGPPKPSELIPQLTEQIDELLSQRSDLARADSNDPRIQENIGKTADVQRLISDLVETEQAQGRRPGDVEQFVGRALERANELGGFAKETIAQLGPNAIADRLTAWASDQPVENVRAAREAFAAANDEELAEMFKQLPEPASSAEVLSQFGGRVAPDAALGAASVPLGRTVSALASSKGASPLTAELLGQAGQEAIIAPTTFGTMEPGEAAVTTLLAPILGTLISRGVSRVQAEELLRNVDAEDFARLDPEEAATRILRKAEEAEPIPVPRAEDSPVKAEPQRAVEPETVAPAPARAERILEEIEQSLEIEKDVRGAEVPKPQLGKPAATQRADGNFDFEIRAQVPEGEIVLRTSGTSKTPPRNAKWEAFLEDEAGTMRLGSGQTKAGAIRAYQETVSDPQFQIGKLEALHPELSRLPKAERDTEIQRLLREDQAEPLSDLRAKVQSLGGDPSDPVALLETTVRGLDRGSRERMEAVRDLLHRLPEDQANEAYHGGIEIGIIRPDERIDLQTRRKLFAETPDELPSARSPKQLTSQELEDLNAFDRLAGEGTIGGGLQAAPLRDTDGNLAQPRVNNLNLERIDAPDSVLEEMLANGRIFGQEIQIARGAKRPLDQVKAEAESLLKDPNRVEALLRKPQGASYTDVEATALRELHVSKFRDLAEVSERFTRGEADADEMARAMFEAKRLELQRASAAAEAGRALSAFRIMASGNLDPAETRAFREIADRIGDFNNPDDMARFIRKIEPDKLRDPNFADKIREYYLMSILSGPRTQSRNIFSNAVTLITALPKRVIAGATDKVLNVAGRERQVFTGEAGSLAFGYGSALPDSIRFFWSALRTGQPHSPAKAVKGEIPHQGAIGGKLGEVIRTPGKLLTAFDDFFAHLNYAGELRAGALRQAKKEGLNGQALRKRVQEILSSEDIATEYSVIHDRAVQFARRGTFTDETALGELTRRAQSLSVRVADKKYQPLRWVVFFARTPASLVTKGVEASPLGFARVAPQLRRPASTVSEDLAEPIFGTMVGMTAFHYATQGLITGAGPENPNERRTLQSTGWQPYSIKVNGRWRSYRGISPLDMVIGPYATAAEAFQRGDEDRAQQIVNSTLRATSDLVVDNTFLSDIGDLVEAFSGPGSAIDRAEKFAGRKAGGFIPNLLNQAGQQLDPRSLDKHGFADELRSRVPGLREEIPSRKDIFNEEIRFAEEGGIGNLAGIVNPFSSSVPKNDAVRSEYARLRIGANPLPLASEAEELSKAIETDLGKRSSRHRELFSSAKGAYVYGRARALVNTEQYQGAADEDKEAVLRGDRSDASRDFNRAYRDLMRRVNTFDSLEDFFEAVAERASRNRTDFFRTLRERRREDQRELQEQQNQREFLKHLEADMEFFEQIQR